VSRRLDSGDPDFETAFADLLSLKRETSAEVDGVVAEILADVVQRGDAAVIEYTSRFDRLDLTPETLSVSAEEIDAAIAATPADQRAALETAATRITDYHARQRPGDADWTDDSGVRLGWRWTPSDSRSVFPHRTAR